MCGVQSLPEPYVHITLFMERHALIEYRSHQNSLVRNEGGNRDFGIYSSPSGVSANQAESRSATTRPGPIENEHECFRRYNLQKPYSAGVDKVEAAGRKIPGHGYVVGEICRTENPFPFHPRRDGEDWRRYYK